MGIYVYYTHSRLHKLYTQIIQGDSTTMLTPIYIFYLFIQIQSFGIFK